MPPNQAVGVGDRRPWFVTTLWIAVLVAGGVGCLTIGWERPLSSIFLLGVGGGLLVVASVVGWVMGRIDDRPLTVATMITLGRGAALAVFAGFLVVGVPTGQLAWVPAGLFALAAGLDAVDGAIARRTDTVSELGGRLDTEMDGLTVLFGTVSVVAAGFVPMVFLIVGIARYAFVFGIRRRRRRGLPVEALPPSQLRRVLGGVAMATIWLALLPVVDPAVSRLVALVVCIPFVLNFSLDWLSVSGRR